MVLPCNSLMMRSLKSNGRNWVLLKPCPLSWSRKNKMGGLLFNRSHSTTLLASTISWPTTVALFQICFTLKCKSFILIQGSLASFADRKIHKRSFVWCQWIGRVSLASSSSLTTSMPIHLGKKEWWKQNVLNWKSVIIFLFMKISSGAWWWPCETLKLIL